MRELAARGNIVLVIEHDPLVIRAADRVVELGPGAGTEGGRIVVRRHARGAREARRTRDGARARARATRRARAEPNAAVRHRAIVGARANNLRDVDVDDPARRRRAP